MNFFLLQIMSAKVNSFIDNRQLTGVNVVEFMHKTFHLPDEDKNFTNNRNPKQFLA